MTPKGRREEDPASARSISTIGRREELDPSPRDAPALGSTQVDYRFLRYLAARGSGRIHPRGRNGTLQLIGALGLSGGERVLEIGCGTGVTLLEIARRNRVRLEGVDVLPEMLAVARRRIRLAGRTSRIALLRARGDRLPITDGVYDRVYSESVMAIQSGPALRSLLREVLRVLRPGGLVVANEAVWRAGTTRAQAQAINARCIESFGLPQSLGEPWGAERWAEEFSAMGFQVISDASFVDDEVDALPAGDRRDAIASNAVGFWLLVKAFVSAPRRAERRRYRESLTLVREMSRSVEARLFVLRKPTPRAR